MATIGVLSCLINIKISYYKYKLQIVQLSPWKYTKKTILYILIENRLIFSELFWVFDADFEMKMLKNFLEIFN